MRALLARLLQAGALLLTVPLVLAAPPAPSDVSHLLDEAERIRKDDHPRSRALLDQANAALAANPDPRLIARAQLLECRFADTPEPALRAVAIGLDAAAKVRDNSLTAKLHGCRGLVFQATGKNLDAEREFSDEARLADLAGDRETKGEALANVGFLEYERGAMAQALANFETAYRIAEAKGDEKSRLDILGLIANVYADAHVAQYDKAVEYYKQALALYEKRQSMHDIGDTLFNIGSTLDTKGDLAAAEVYYRRALRTFESAKAPAADIAYCQRALGNCLVKQGRADVAMPLLNAAVQQFESAKDASEAAAAHQIRGIAERRLGRYADALRDLGIARPFFEAQKNTRYLERNIRETALAYAGTNAWRDAYEQEARHSALQEQLADERRDELSSRLRVSFDTSKKEQENRALLRENALRTAALRAAERERQWQWVAIALTALLAVALAVLFWRQVANTRRMRTMAMTDELTRLPNRRHILALAQAAFTESERTHKPLSVIAFDIDHFKRVNDTWGHGAGDEVLKSVTRTCRMSLRPSDVVGRTGGEEFLVVLRDTELHEAVNVAERLRAAVERVDVTSIDPSLHVTISLGVRTRTDESSIDVLVREADELLYRAKSGGRNRVTSAA